MMRGMIAVRSGVALGQRGGARAGGAGFRSGGMRFHPGLNRFIFVGGGGWDGWGWPWGWGGYPYGYPYGYDYSAYAQPQPACPTNLRLSDADLKAVQGGQSIRLTGANQCGQAIDVTLNRVGASSQVSGLDGEFFAEPPLDGDGGYGFTPFGESPPPAPVVGESPPPAPAVGEYEPPVGGYGDPPTTDYWSR